MPDQSPLRRAHLLRVRDDHAHSPVTYIELFFDLVFVFAITQLSHSLLAHPDLAGAARTLCLFLPVWWVWIYTSWTTNWLDPERAATRLMLIAMMAAGLVMAIAIPDAFGASGWMFALAYTAMQIGRSLYMVWIYHGAVDGHQRNFIRISFYFLLSLPLWLLGAAQPPEFRLVLWLAAIAIEYAGPLLNFRTPGLSISTTADWDISGGHLAERCALFIIIALGEAVLVTGAAYANLPHDRATTQAFITSFIGCAACWWIYFDVGAKRGTSVITNAADAGRIGRSAYTYLHMPIVAGIVVIAVADEWTLTRPAAHGSTTLLLLAFGGPWLFLFGNLAFKWMTAGSKYPPLSHMVGLLLLSLVAGLSWWLGWPQLELGMAATGILVLTAVWEWRSLNGGWQGWFRRGVVSTEVVSAGDRG